MKYLIPCLIVIASMAGCASNSSSSSQTNQPENLTITSKQDSKIPGVVTVTVYPHSAAPGSVDISAIGAAKVNSVHDYENGKPWKNNFTLWYGGEGIFGSPYFKIMVYSHAALASIKVTFHGQSQTFSVASK